MKKVNSLMMYALAGAMIFSACNKDDDEDDTPAGDTTKPTATLSAPAEGSETDAAVIQIDGSVADETNLASYKVTVTNGGSTAWDTTVTVSGKTATISHQVPTAGWTAGASSVAVSATDAANNASAEVTNNFTMKDPKPVDTEKPVVNSITVNIPVNGDLSNGFNNKVTFNVTDNVGLEKIEIEVYDKDTPQSCWTKTIMKADMTDNTAYNEQLTINFNKTFGLNTSGEIRVKATDEAGNVGEMNKAVRLQP